MHNKVKIINEDGTSQSTKVLNTFSYRYSAFEKWLKDRNIILEPCNKKPVPFCLEEYIEISTKHRVYDHITMVNFRYRNFVCSAYIFDNLEKDILEQIKDEILRDIGH